MFHHDLKMQECILTNCMKVCFVGILCFLAGCTSEPTRREPNQGELTAGEVFDFRLTDHLGRSHELYYYSDAKAIVLFSQLNGCPIVRQTIPLIKDLRNRYEKDQVVFLMLNGNPYDDLESVIEEAEEFNIDIPILLDETQLITEGLEIKRSATALLIDPKSWKIVYRGAVDDRFDYGARKQNATHNWLEDAIVALLEGKEVETPRTETKGCIIEAPQRSSQISYAQDVAPILEQKCILCHSEGKIGPFAMSSYKAVRGRAGMIREVILTRRMPPWHADPHYGKFSNDLSLSPVEMRTLVEWIDAGAPRGGTDPLASRSQGKPQEWPLGEPDLVVEAPNEVEIPADGVIDYIYQQVPWELTEDVWVRAVDVRPEDPRVAHHISIFVIYPDRLSHLQPEYNSTLNGYFAIYGPGGGGAVEFPPSTGKLIPAGALIQFQIHYLPIGKPVKDRPRIGLYFHKEKPQYELRTESAYDINFEIPPGAQNHLVSARFQVTENIMVWGLAPHMHFRGSHMKMEALYPDGKRTILLSVPKYDFNWQRIYRFKQPLRLPKGTVIECSGGFDNSAKNPLNPDPQTWLKYGQRSFDEMFIGYIDYTILTENMDSIL